LVTRPEVLAVVQARGGSKGLPGKNIRDLFGHPLVAYSVASAKAARQITRIIISTDCEKIAEVARKYGAEVPFIRPPQLAEDNTPDFPLFQHALETLKSQSGYMPDLVVQLRPTTPLRPVGMVDEAIEIMLNSADADCVRGVTTPKQTPYKMWRNGENGFLAPLMETEFAEPYNMPRQSLPATYWQTGHIDVIRTRTITEQHSLTGRKVLPLMIDQSYCVDIDTAADLEHAASLLQQGRMKIDLPSISGDLNSAELPSSIDLVVFDFDGVFTDNRVIVLQDGREAVICNRSDGMGVSLLKKQGMKMLVLSTETNPVVAARCQKLGLDYVHGIENKLEKLRALAAERDIPLSRIAYLGNDVNDLECLRAVGLAVVPADAHLAVHSFAKLKLNNRGGEGAVREFCDFMLLNFNRNASHVSSH
jgi:N-acylneuraminate cytidylyltransferase